MKSDEPPMRTDEEIAKLAGVGKDTVRKSEVIEKEGSPEVKEAVRKGKMSVNKAYKETRQPKSEIAPEGKVTAKYGQEVVDEMEGATDKQSEKEEKAKQKAIEIKTKKLEKSKTLGKLRYYWSIADEEERREFKQWIKKEGN